MDPAITVRPARLQDATAMARMHVRSWQETYRGLMADSILDDPGLVDARQRFWTVALSDERYRANRAAVAEQNGEIIGVAMAGPAEGPGGSPAIHLYILHVLASHHGSGAGEALLDAVIGPEEPAVLWVADPNPRAQAFYRKHGFVPVGAAQVEDGVRDIRMIKVPAAEKATKRM